MTPAVLHLPEHLTLARVPSREPCAEPPALLRDERGRVMAQVEVVGEPDAWAAAVERVRRALRVV